MRNPREFPLAGKNIACTIAGMNKTYRGYVLTILSSLGFASTSLFFKLAFGFGMSAFSITLVQSAFALLLLGWMWVREPSAAGPRPAVPRVSVLLFMVAGATSTIAFNVALEHLSISLATILLFTYPAFVALGAWAVLGHSPWFFHVVALGMTLAGAVLTVNLSDFSTGQISALGVGLSLLAAVSHGVYIVLGERLAGSLTAVRATTLTRMAIVAGSVLLSPRVVAELPAVAWQGWAICAVAAAVAGVAPFLFLNRGIALIGANRAAIASVAELPFAMALGMLFQGDLILLWQWVGAGLIVAAVVISQQRPPSPLAQEGT